ncbi:MAG: hypothetical protein JOZ25_00865 [Actinobacteria bacterium]|nr:hypothetical protein [Actinomycetota bacterium]
MSGRSRASRTLVEVLAAVGLILPAALGILPVLTALAASGVILLMVDADTGIGTGASSASYRR